MYKPTGTNVTPLGAKRRFNDGPSDRSNRDDYHSSRDDRHSSRDYSSRDRSDRSDRRSRDDDRYSDRRGHDDRRGYDDRGYSDSHRSTPSAQQYSYPPPHASSPTPSNTSSNTPSTTEDGSDRKKKRKSRWGDEQKVIIPGLPTSVSKLSKEQSEKYLLQIRLEEINRKLRLADFKPSDSRARSPSPEPVYNADGKRINTREARYKKKLEDERHKLMEIAIKTIPNFRPPADYKRPTKTQEKVYIPDKEFPEINFIGQLIGPRGNTLKSMESESGAKISIRGRGSVKEGKSRTDAASGSGQEEDLHCLVTADTEDKVRKAVKLIEKVIETSASVPEGQNELKRNQLRELAALNGTLRDDENQTCLNCGASGHRRYECPERQNITTSLTCHICGGGGHIARDCNQRNNPEMVNQARERDNQLDSEYMNLMAELGETVPEGGAKPTAYNNAAPWQQQRPSPSMPGGAAPPWQQPRAAAAAPPWSQGGNPAPAPPASSAPWQSAGNDSYGGYTAAAPPGASDAAGYYGGYGASGDGHQADAYGYGAQGSYGADGSYGAEGYYAGYYDQSQAPPPPGGNPAPWQQQAPTPGVSNGDAWGMAPPPPPPADDSLPPPPPSSDPAPPPPPPSE